MLSGIRNREDPVFRVFYHIKNRRGNFGTDEIVRFHGDSGIERIRFRGFLLYFGNKMRLHLPRMYISVHLTYASFVTFAISVEFKFFSNVCSTHCFVYLFIIWNLF